MKSFIFSGLLFSIFFQYSHASNGSTLIQFEENTIVEQNNWLIVNDSVMGGRSVSQFDITDSEFQFSGVVSLQNNGGFASVRRRFIKNEALDAQLFKLTFTGDNQVYKIRFRVNGYLDGPAYETTLLTDGSKQVVEFSSNEFIAMYRNRLLSNAPAFNFSNAMQLEIMFADKQEGKFDFVIHSIEFLR